MKIKKLIKKWKINSFYSLYDTSFTFYLFGLDLFERDFDMWLLNRLFKRKKKIPVCDTDDAVAFIYNNISESSKNILNYSDIERILYLETIYINQFNSFDYYKVKNFIKESLSGRKMISDKDIDLVLNAEEKYMKKIGIMEDNSQ